MTIYMRRVYFIIPFLCAFFSSCQRFEALNDPDILTALNQQSSLNLSHLERKRINEIQVQEVFTPPKDGQKLTLSDLFGISVANNPQISKMYQESRQAAARYSETLSKYLPDISLDFGVAALRESTPFYGLISTENYWTWGPKMNLDLLIFDFSQRSNNSESYYQLLQSANLAHKQTLQTTLKNVADKYYNYIYNLEKLEADKADLLNYEQDYKAAQKKAQLGISSKSDVLLAQSKYLNADIIVVNQETVNKNSFVDLVKELGISPENKFEVKGFDKNITISKQRPSKLDLVEIAKLQRPDFLEKKALVLSKEFAYKSRKAKHYPSIKLSATAGESFYSTGDHDSGTYDIKLGLTFPLFTGFLITNEIRQAQSELKEAVASLRKTKYEMIQEVYTAYNNIVNYEKQIILTQEYLQASEQEQVIIFEKYKKGIATILDLLQASSSLSDARAKAIKAKKGYYVALIDLSYATGALTNAKG